MDGAPIPIGSRRPAATSGPPNGDVPRNVVLIADDLTPRFDSAWGVAVQTDGSIVCSGVAGSGGSHASLAVVRYKP